MQQLVPSVFLHSQINSKAESFSPFQKLPRQKHFISMLSSHICHLVWAQASCTTLRTVTRLLRCLTGIYIPITVHTPSQTLSLNLWSWDDLIKHTEACLVFKIVAWLLPRLSAFIKSADDRQTRSVTRGDCIITTRRTVSESSSDMEQPANTYQRPIHIVYLKST